MKVRYSLWTSMQPYCLLCWAILNNVHEGGHVRSQNPEQGRALCWPGVVLHELGHSGSQDQLHSRLSRICASSLSHHILIMNRTLFLSQNKGNLWTGTFWVMHWVCTGTHTWKGIEVGWGGMEACTGTHIWKVAWGGGRGGGCLQNMGLMWELMRVAVSVVLTLAFHVLRVRQVSWSQTCCMCLCVCVHVDVGCGFELSFPLTSVLQNVTDWQLWCQCHRVWRVGSSDANVIECEGLAVLMSGSQSMKDWQLWCQRHKVWRVGSSHVIVIECEGLAALMSASQSVKGWQLWCQCCNAEVAIRSTRAWGCEHARFCVEVCLYVPYTYNFIRSLKEGCACFRLRCPSSWSGWRTCSRSWPWWSSSSSRAASSARPPTTPTCRCRWTAMTRR